MKDHSNQPPMPDMKIAVYRATITHEHVVIGNRSFVLELNEPRERWAIVVSADSGEAAEVLSMSDSQEDAIRHADQLVRDIEASKAEPHETLQ